MAVKINNPYKDLSSKGSDYKKMIMEAAEMTSSTINISYNCDAVNKINKVYNKMIKVSRK